MSREQAREMTWADAEPLRKLIDAALIERATVDQAERAVNRRPGSLPRGTERRRLRTTPEARPEARAFGRGSTPVEAHVACQRRSRRADGAAVDSGRLDRDEHDAVPHRITASEGIVLGGEIEHGVGYSECACASRPGTGDHVRKRPATPMSLCRQPFRARRSNARCVVSTPPSTLHGVVLQIFESTGEAPARVRPSQLQFPAFLKHAGFPDCSLPSIIRNGQRSHTSRKRHLPARRFLPEAGDDRVASVPINSDGRTS